MKFSARTALPRWRGYSRHRKPRAWLNRKRCQTWRTFQTHYLQLNDDGTARRKHDIEDQKQRRPIFFFSVAGFAFFNFFALMKTIWYGEDNPQEHSTHPRGILPDEARQQNAAGEGDSMLRRTRASDPPAPPQTTRAMRLRRA